MNDFGELKRIPLREIWSHEADDFTPWLAENIEALGDALGLELELTDKEASVGDFSLDLLATDLNSSSTVIIENQFSQTNHDHLGKLLTYSAGFDASVVIWISEEVRDEHRQALEWLNQKTGLDTQFFAVVVEILTIDNSKPAYNFKPVVFPNEWQKSERQKVSTSVSPKGMKYQSYFQGLVDELREQHNFTRARSSQPNNWYAFASGFGGIRYFASFVKGNKIRTAIHIERENRELYDYLEERRAEINSNFGSTLNWEREDANKRQKVAVYRDGTIESPESELQEIRAWQIENLLKLKEMFTPQIERALETIGNGEL